MFEKTETNSAIITKLDNVRKHPNADRLQLATACGDQVIVGPDSKDGDVVIYLDSNLCLSHEFLYNNNLYSNKELNLDKTKKGYFCNKGRVRAQGFRGEKSYGFVCPVSFLDFTGPILDANFGCAEFNKCNGVEICKKYIIKQNHEKSKGMSSNKKRKNLHPKTETFYHHWDTAHFKRNIDKIPTNRLVYIEEKLHGTSGRIHKALVLKDLQWYEKLLKFFGVKIQEKEWMCLNGSRRVLLTLKKEKYDPFYKGNVRDVVFNKVKDHIPCGMQLYFEIVGYDTNGGWIQKDFPYGCNLGEHRVILYRISINQEDGKVYNLSREKVYNYATILGFESPFLFEKYYYTGNKEELIAKVDSYTDGQSMIGPNTMREGIVCWFEDDHGEYTCLKNKSFAFLEKEGILKDKKDFIDMEEEG